MSQHRKAKFRINKQKLFLSLGVLLALIVITVTICFVSCAGGGKIRSTYTTIQVPREIRGDLACWEEEQSGAIHQIFALDHADAPLEVFRIVYGDATLGHLQGYLHTDEGAVPVSLVIADYESISFPLGDDVEDIRPAYFAIMDNVGAVLESIRADKRFSVSATAGVEDMRSVKLTYFKVELPAAITVTESEQNGTYTAEFTAPVGGQTLTLYTITIGEGEGTLLGSHSAGGSTRSVYVQPIAGDVVDQLPEADHATVAVLMESVNDVVQTMMGSKGFTRN